MINIVSDAIAKWLEMEGAVSNEDRPLYAYAVYSFLFGLLPIGIMLLLGLCFGMIQEGLVLIIPFMMLRKFCGGFHLKSPGICFVTTVGVLAFSLGLVMYIARTEQIEALSVLVCLSSVSLCIFSPVENQARKLSQKEQNVFGVVARVLVLVSLAAYVYLSSYVSMRYASAFGVGIFLVGTSQLPCILQKVLFSKSEHEMGIEKPKRQKKVIWRRKGGNYIIDRA